MKRKIFSKLLMGAFLIASVSMFVSCKDYDDDINKNAADIAALKSQLGTDINDVKSQLTAQLATTNAQIDQLKNDINSKATSSAIDELKQGLATKADATELASLVARAAALESQIAALDDIKAALATKADAASVSALEGQLAAITGKLDSFIDEAKAKEIAEAALKTLDIQGEALKVFQNNIEAALSPYLKAAALNGEVEAILSGKGYLTQSDLATITANVEELQKLMTADYKAKIDALLDTKFLSMEDVKGEIGSEISANNAELKAEFQKTIEELTKQFEDINKSIEGVNANLSTINIFVNKKLTSIVLKPNFYWEGIEGIEAPFIYQTPVFEEKGAYTFKYDLTDAPAGSTAVNVWVEKSMGWKGFGDKRELAKYVFAGPAAAHANYPVWAVDGTGAALAYNMGATNNKNVTKLNIAYGAVAKYNLNPSIADIENATLGFFENDAPVYTRAQGLSINPQVIADGVKNNGGLLTVPFTVDYENVVKYFVDWTNSQTTNWEGKTGAQKEDWSKFWYNVPGGAVYGSDDRDATSGCSDDVYNANLPFVSLKIDVPADKDKEQEAYTVNSDWAVVVPALYQIVALADRNPDEALDLGTFTKPAGNHEIRKNHLYETVGYDDSGIRAMDATKATPRWNDVKGYGAIPMPATHGVLYNGSIDLMDYVCTHYNYLTAAQYGKSSYDGILDDKDGGQLMKDLGLEYRFTVINYTIGTETTSESAHIQQFDGKAPGSKFVPVSVDENGKSIYDKPATREVCDREPLIRVDLVSTKDNNAIIRYGYIKLRIVEAESVLNDLEVAIDLNKDLYMNCGDEAKITWSQVENLILAKLGTEGFTKKEFEKIYKLDVYGDYQFMPFLDPTAFDAANTDNAGPLYTKTWQAKRYWKKSGAAPTSTMAVASGKDYAPAIDGDLVECDDDSVAYWTNKNNHFGEVWYTPHDNSTEGHNWDEQTNVLIWNFFQGDGSDAKSYRTVYDGAVLGKDKAGNMDNAKYQKLMKETGVTYLTKGNSQKEISTVVRFINKQTGRSLWVTLTVPAKKLWFEYGYVENKNWSHWFKFNSAEGGVLDTEGNIWPSKNGVLYGTEFDTRINPFKPSNVNYRDLTVEDFNQLLTDHWMDPANMIKYYGGGNFGKFEGAGKWLSTVSFQFTYPEVGTNSATMNAANDNTYGKVWDLYGASGTKWTLAVGAHGGTTWAAGTDAIWVVKKNGNKYEEEVAYLDGGNAFAQNVKIHYHGIESAADLYPAATDLVNKMGAYDKNGEPNFETTSSELTNLTSASFLEENKDRAFTAYVKILVSHQCYDPIISKQFFNVRFHRPINVVGKEYNWDDQKLNDNYINIKDLIEIVDWNRFPVVAYKDEEVKASKSLFGMAFPAYETVYGGANKVKKQNKGLPYEFYGISELAVRYGEIRSDMPMSMAQRRDLATTLANVTNDKYTRKIGEIPALYSDREAPKGYKTITLLNADGTIAGWNANDYNLSDYNAAAPGNTSYGRIYFNNDGSDTQLFHIFIPIAVKYNWGNIAYDKKLGVPAKLDKDYTQVVWATITVKGTH